MANRENLTIQLDSDLKAQAAELFQALGMDISTATGIFFRQALRCHGLPFAVVLDEPNEETMEAIREVEEMKKDPALGKGYTDVDAMIKELLS